MAKAIMIQGTMSNVGKSLITAALCRIFRQDGYSVAPFKSQNMALNSYITAEGLEMGRAQVMQAEAAGIEPSVLMNPILLKPTSDTGSQVIVNGEVLGNFPAREYFRRKQELIPQIMSAYKELDSQYDIIVLEGAGSPAEINLKQHDIVNMGMAKLAKAPVLLVGDIDRGGVFASLAGTMQLLEPDERARIKGLIINQFRGDIGILRPGLDSIEKIVERPVLGVIPYMKIDLDEEDSLSGKFGRHPAANLLDIAVIRLPRISNFTDFHPLEWLDGVGLRYVTTPEELGDPAMVILPGSKNTMEDLLWLRQTGLEAAVKKLAAKGTIIFGICGGYQMLGVELSDPDGAEGGQAGKTMQGLGLLPLVTVFTEQKVRAQVTGHFLPETGALRELSGARFSGYEIHMGKTCLLPEDAALLTEANCADGRASLCEIMEGDGKRPDGFHTGTVYGTYIHGVFDHEETANSLLASLCRMQGIGKLSAINLEEYKESQYNLLAKRVRESLDMPAIYQILNAGAESEQTPLQPTNRAIHLYCGDGKGKTTEALGLAIRAAGRGWRVLMVQFLKSSFTGELESLKQIPNIKVIRSEKQLGFTFQMSEEEKAECKEIQQNLFRQGEEAALAGGCDLLIMDEIMAACSTGMVQEEQVLELVRWRKLNNKPFEFVLTGRNPPQSFVDMADYVSEIKKVKHPFDEGIGARDGIEQ